MKKTLIASTVLFLSACGSNIPSDKEIKKNITESFKDCSIAIIKDIERLNGEETTDKNKYLVDIAFKLEFKEADGARKLKSRIDELSTIAPILAEKRIQKKDALRNISVEIAEREDQEQQQAAAEIDSRPIELENSGEALRKKERDKREAYYSIKEKYEKIYRKEITEKIEAIENDPEDLEFQKESDELHAKINKINKEYRQSCKTNNTFINRTFFTPGVDLQNAYLGGKYNIEFKKLQMKKTENGWIFE